MIIKDNRKVWDRLRNNLNKIDRSYTKVGFLENGQLGRMDSPDVGTQKVNTIQKMIIIALANNYGVKKKDGQGWRIPPTHFFERGIDDNSKSISNLQEKILTQVMVTNLGVKHGLDLIGEFTTNKIQNKIVQIRQPRNAPATIQYKGFDNRLIHTGQMKNTVSHKAKLI